MKKLNISTPKYPDKFTLVDDEDYEELNQWKWRFDNLAVIRQIWNKREKRGITLSMHREIMKPLKGMVIDHKNHDRLDNRKSNLRICTQSQNLMNIISNRGSSKYKGVYRHPINNVWIACIRLNSKGYNLGSFKTEKEAAKQYNCAAYILFGKFSYENIL